MKLDREKIVYKKVEDLKLNPKNPRKNDDAVRTVAKSIEKYGFKNPLIIDENNVVWCGNTRLKASRTLGLEEVPCIVASDLTEEQIRELALIDNKSSEIAEWDFDLLGDELADLDLGDFELDWGLPELVEEEKGVEEDDFDCTPPEQPKAKLGDIYKLGNHRLMCGDSTKEEDVAKLMNGNKADMVVTDPPYNVEIVGGNHSESPTERKKKGNLTIKNDKMESEDFYNFLLQAFNNLYTFMKDGASFYVWYASREVVNFSLALGGADLSVKQELVWNKNSLVMGRQDYQWKHEPCLYGWKETASHNWYGDRKQTTIIDCERPSRSDLHPTMKPIKLFDLQIKNSSKKDDIVLDLFGGSGTTLMACEQNGRRAYLMEFDPRYVDVIINRWEEYTGQKAEKING